MQVKPGAIRRAHDGAPVDDGEPAPRQTQGETRSTPLTLTKPAPRASSPHPLPVHSWDPSEAQLRDASAGAIGRLRNRVARLGRRAAQVASQDRADMTRASPVVMAKAQSTPPPQHPPPAVADEPAPAAGPSEWEDEGELVHSMPVRHRDPQKDRRDELLAQRSWLLQSPKEWSWSWAEPIADQTVLGILMNMKMAANPCLEVSAVRRAGIHHLRAEISRVDLELAALAAAALDGD